MEINNDDFDDDEVFEESSVLAHFENYSFRDGNGIKSTENALDVSALCCDEEIKGFDKLTGKTWIYPTNYPIRDYQYNIIKAGLLKNTLVSLPTGLGKTFIAAVVMYNFYRWYPTGKIIFMAPTRPLVAQQIEACYNIIALPQNDTIEMTGHMPGHTRKTHWQTKRVFFATPQVIYNDIKSGICQGDRIRCLVIDEAHKARGNYSYCQIFATLTEMGHRVYRVLALSATPGSKVEDVINVVKNLHIAHLELRNENCIDVAPYSYSRKINTVVIPLGPELTQLKQQYIEILDGYARRLKEFNILPLNLGNLTKGRIVMLYKEFQTKERGARHPQHNLIMKDFTLLITLFHGLELLVKHGSRVFLNFFDEHPEKSWMQADDKLTALLERLRDDLGVDPFSLDRSVLPDGTIPDIPQNLVFGHPKFYKLKEIMIEHFTAANKNGQETKAIVFCEYRESVHLVHCLLLQCRPLIVPQMFVGQGVSGRAGAGGSQRQQLRALRGFRAGACNALVATCVAEEGLDVGAVDLILCFDVASRSPIRLVQRCGRTGRQRVGHVHILVTEGKEHQTLLECMRQRDGLNDKILHSKEVKNNLYKLNPRMMPSDWTPECQKMYITVDKSKTNGDAEQSTKVQSDLRNLLCRRDPKGSSKSANREEWITKHEFDKIYPKGYRECNFFLQPTAYFTMSNESIRNINDMDQSLLKLSTWKELQRNLQETINIGHSEDTEILVSVLKSSDGKSSDLFASAQTSDLATQDSQSQNVFISPIKNKSKQTVKRQKIPLIKSPCKRDGDIRTLFSTATKSTKNYTKLINDLGIHNNGNIPTRIINLLVDLCLENTNMTKSCYICLNVCNCKVIQSIRDKENLSFLMPIDKEPNLPNIDLIDDLNIDSFINYANDTNNDDIRKDVTKDAGEIKIDIVNNNVHDSINNFNIEFEYDSSCEQDSQFNEQVNPEENITSKHKNFDIGDVDDIFAESSPETVFEVDVAKNKTNLNETLHYFQLDSIEDIFANSDDEVPNSVTGYNTSPLLTSIVKSTYDGIQQTSKDNSMRAPSPSILYGEITKNKDKSTSPILCSQMRKPNRTRDLLNQFQSSTPLNNANVSTNKSEKTYDERNLKDSSDNSMFTITELVNIINATENEDRSAVTTSIVYGGDENVENGTSSPIIFTQQDIKIKREAMETEKQKVPNNQTPQSESIVISDSDDENTQEYRINAVKTKVGNKSTKRKFEDENCDSPYFNKKPKINDSRGQQLTVQKNILAALTSNRFSNDSFGNGNAQANFMFLSPRSSPRLIAHQENEDPLPFKSQKSKNDVEKLQTKLDKLQIYRRDAKCSPAKVFQDCTNTTAELLHRRKITFSDSDDDFVSNEKPQKKIKSNGYPDNAVINHKIRKKKPANEFLDLEAELSEDGKSGSGDELTDESVGSIIDFICDDNVTHDEEDIQAVYLRSVKSPVAGVFKIPQLTYKHEKKNVFSQYGVENDTYENDSFCVDSHVGLTQNHELSELEIAEMLLEKKRRNRISSKNKPKTSETNDDSPIIKRKFRNVVRQISSDSEDSS